MVTKNKQIKVRKIGNSIGALFPKEWRLVDGDLIEYEETADGKILLDINELGKAHDRAMIEAGFDYTMDQLLSKEEVAEQLKDLGW
jgi:hypothetical protein